MEIKLELHTKAMVLKGAMRMEEELLINIIKFKRWKETIFFSEIMFNRVFNFNKLNASRSLIHMQVRYIKVYLFLLLNKFKIN